MLNFTVDPKRCTRCGLCVRDCIARIITRDGDAVPSIAPENEEACLQCQHCLAVCPPAGRMPRLHDRAPFACHNVSHLWVDRTVRQRTRTFSPPVAAHAGHSSDRSKPSPAQRIGLSERSNVRRGLLFFVL